MLQYKDPQTSGNVSAESITKRYDMLDSKRANHKTRWDQNAFYFVPQKQNIISQRTPGQKLPPDLYDSTGIEALQVFAAGLMGYLTNPSSTWFALASRDRGLMEITDIKQYFHDLQEAVYAILSGSNFYQEIHEHYLDLGSFGTPALYQETDPRDVVRFYSRPIEEYVIDVDATGRVDTLMRKFKYSARQAMQRWDHNLLPEQVHKAYKTESDKEFEFIHAVFPRVVFDPRKSDSSNFPFASYYVCIEGKRMLEEGGYHEFPFFVPRYGKTSGDNWGYCPADIALADMKQLNKMEWTVTTAGQKMVAPPIILPHKGYLLPFKTGPDAINYRLHASTNPNDKIEVLRTEGNIPIGLDMQEIKRQSIKRKFFNDLFMILADQKNMTATEVIQKVSERMVLLGPALGRLISDLLDPVITRTINIGFREGVLPEPPQILLGSGYDIDFVGPLAKAQRIQDINSLSNFLSLTAQIAQFLPEVLDRINSDQVLDDASNLYGVNPEILRSDEEVEKIREARMQKQEIMDRLTLVEQAAGVMKTSTEADANTRKGVAVGS